MDNTLGSIRPSDVGNSQEDMSYLFGRDPSILSYGQRPCLLENTKKNLLSIYETEEFHTIETNVSRNLESPAVQTVKVYLRMKPLPKKLKLTQEQQEAYRIINSTTLFTRLPTLENNVSCIKRSNSTDIVCRKFTFTKTFGPETTQLELFEQAIKQQMLDFLAGQNSTIMTYGTTNSGKSYTLQGTTTSPGIIPRCLEFVFSNITPKSTPSYKPINHCDVVPLDALERAQELEMKTKLLTFASADKYQYINAYKEMQKLLQAESPIRPSQSMDAHYSVWVSFAEIYNEIVYDLLSNECQKKRSPLKLATDSQGRTFIKGLRMVCVNSGSEAYQVLMAGQYNLKVAATALNARSSRSHCIFTIKLLKYYIENDQRSVDVSTFAFCDLAGSERLKKTLNIGDRLKEAQNINTSLLVLGRCLKTIHEGQLSKQKIEHVGPFRESKLTRLFQKALSGKEHIALIVNINPLPNLYIETQNVLNFSAIAKKIVIEKEKVQKKRKSRFSQLVTQSIKTVTDWDTTELESEEWQTTVDDHGLSIYTETEYNEKYEDILNENSSLKKEIAVLKSSALTRDLQIRQEMADTYTAMMRELETQWKNRIKDVEEQQEDVLQWSVKQVEEFYKQKLSQVNSRKRRRSSISDNSESDDSKMIEDLEMENSQLNSKVVVLKSSVKELKELNQSLTVDLNKATFELGLVKDELKNIRNLLHAAKKDIGNNEDTTCYIEELNSQLFSKQEQVKKLKVFLNEAKEEYIAITTEMRDKEYTIKIQEEELLEKQEAIDELESNISHINICLTEKTKAVEILEEKLENQTKQAVENQTKQAVENERKMQEMQEKMSKLETEKAALLDEVELLKKTAKSNVTQETRPKNDECEKPSNSSTYNESDILIDEKEFSHLNVEVVVEYSDENDMKVTNVETESQGDQTKDELVFVKAENSALKEKLIHSTTEIQNVKQELKIAKTNLIDISKQVSSLMAQLKVEKNDEENKIPKETAEIGCQVEIEIAELSESLKESPSRADILDKSSQTIDSETRDSTNQTSFCEDINDSLDELAKFTVKYHDMKTQYKEKCQTLEKAEEKVLILKNKMDELSEECNTNKKDVIEYKKSMETLQKELCSIKEDKVQLEGTLQATNSTKAFFEAKIKDCEQRLKEAEEKLSVSQIDYKQCTKKLNEVQENFAAHVSKWKTEHEEAIRKLQTELSSAEEKLNIKSQCLDVHAAKVMELEHNLGGLTELQEKIAELNSKLEVCQAEKDHLRQLLDENNEKLLELEDRLESADEKEREKDAEIISLQKEMKNMIQKVEVDERGDKVMEIEMKNTLRSLTAMKETLSRKDEYIEQLQTRIKHSEQNAKILDLLQQTAQERQAENERLRAVNKELNNTLVEKEREMEAFIKNRDEMVSKYESLVKTQQEELEKQKQTVPNQYSKAKDYCENTTDDESAVKERRTRRGQRKCLSVTPIRDDSSVIELSGSETKRFAKCTNLPLPGDVTEQKKSTRRKKLYIPEVESSQDVEPLESTIIITPSTKTRNLRSRRK